MGKALVAENRNQPHYWTLPCPLSTFHSDNLEHSASSIVCCFFVLAGVTDSLARRSETLSPADMARTTV